MAESTLSSFFSICDLLASSGGSRRNYSRDGDSITATVREAAKPPPEPVEKQEEEVIHEDNEWGICLVSETPADEGSPAECTVPGLAPGIQLAYTVPEPQKGEDTGVAAESEQTLEELMAQMKSL